MKREPLGKRRWLCKHLARQCGVGKCLMKREYQNHSKCPRCDQDGEDTSHVIRCRAPTAYRAWIEATNKLSDWLLQERTSQCLTDAILARLSAWRAGDPLMAVQGPPGLMEAIACQDALGWENFILGRIAPQLANFQQRHYTNIRSTKTASNWLSRLINQVWLVVWKMWEHRNRANKSDATAQQKRERGVLLQKVRHQFAMGKQSLLAADRNLLADKAMLLNYSLKELQQWSEKISNARQAAARQTARQNRALEASQAVMARWQARASNEATEQRRTDTEEKE